MELLLIKKNVDVVRHMCWNNNFDVIFLQETFLTNNDLSMLNLIDENYYGIGVAASFSERSLQAMAGRPMGGLACLYKKSPCFKLDILHFSDNFMVVSLNTGDKLITLVNLYIRSDLGDSVSMNAYLATLHDIQAFLDDNYFKSIYLCGDFNADVRANRAWEHVLEFMKRNNFICYDLNMLPDDSYSYISHAYAHCKWLDHIIGISYDDINVRDIEICHDMLASDHLPISMCILVPDSVSVEFRKNDFSSDFVYVEWENLKDKDFNFIFTECDKIIGKFNQITVNKCNNWGCNNSLCLNEIDKMYDKLVVSVEDSLKSFCRAGINRNKFKAVPGWNRSVKEYYNLMRVKYKNWRDAGRLKSGPVFEEMCFYRSKFKEVLRECKNNINNEIVLSIEEKFRLKSMTSFWREIRKVKGKTPVTEIIDHKSSVNEIINIFNDKFLKNNVNICNDFNSEMLIKNIWHTSQKHYTVLSSYTLKKLIDRLNKGCGHDMLHSSLLKRASEDFLNNLSIFLNCCLLHCYIPKNLLKGEITPIIKDSKGDLTSSQNYRPIMLSSNILKIFEIHVLDVLEEKIFLDSKQFGYVKGVSTSDACLLLKETVNSYINKNNSVFCAFIDLSKAFDLVNIQKLIKILIDEYNVPIDIVRIILSYLNNQSARVKWKKLAGEFIDIKSGVRQGGILSPFLFKIYINHIIKKVTETNIGCKLGLRRVNIICYADDVVILANSLENLKYLFSYFVSLVSDLSLKINKNKSKIMIFNKSKSKQKLQDIEIDGVKYEVVPRYKYLGFVITENLNDSYDVKDKLNKFYISFNCTYRNFLGVSLPTLKYLFNAYSVPSYGVNLWFSYNLFRNEYFRSFEVAYSNSLKRILNVPLSSSSHECALMCQALLLKHHVALLQAKYFKRFLKSTNPIFMINKFHFLNGYCFKNVLEHFYRFYMTSIVGNSIDVILSRLYYVQNILLL